MSKAISTMVLAFFLVACGSPNVPTAADSEVFVLEEYLIDFSKKIEGYKLKGGSLPTDLDGDSFFAVLEELGPGKEMIEAVREYPVRVYFEGGDYVLVLCDRDSRYALMKDLGQTTDKVDFRYLAEGIQAPCGQE